MIVTDSMVVVYLLLRHPSFSEDIDRLFDLDPVWCAPSLWRSEVRNVLVQYVRSTNPEIPGSELDVAQAAEYMRDAEELVGSQTFDVDSEAVLHLALESGCSAYDCEYVTLARDLDLRLLTYDRQVLAAFPEQAVRPDDFVA